MREDEITPVGRGRNRPPKGAQVFLVDFQSNKMQFLGHFVAFKQIREGLLSDETTLGARIAHNHGGETTFRAADLRWVR